MTADQLRWRATAALAAVVLGLLALFAGMAGVVLWSALPAALQDGVAAALAPQRAVLAVVALALAGAAAAALQPLLRRWLLAPRALDEAAALLLHGPQAAPLPAGGGAALAGLAATLAALAGQRDQLRADIAAAVAQASQGVLQERNRLAALMHELSQSVVVCNLDGRVLLYNPRARLQMARLARSAGAAGEGAAPALIGLGRSIHGVLDRGLVTHALEAVQQRLARGEAHPSAQFVTATAGGQLLRVQLAPVRAADGDAPAAADAATPATTQPLAGYVLVLDDITRSHAHEAAQDRALLALTEGQRGSLANLQAAVEMLDDPQLPPPLQAQFLGVVRDEALAMGRRLNALDLPAASRWPLDEMRGADFLQAAASAMARAVQPTGALNVGLLDVDEGLWLQLDSFALLQALCGLAVRLHDERDLRTLHLRLQAAPAAGAAPGMPASPSEGGQGARAHLDLVWSGSSMSTETAMGWELDALPAAAGSTAPPLSVRDVVQRHGGAFWFERDRVRHQAFFRFLLPQAQPVAALAPGDSRPEVVDFDLFAQFDGDGGHALDERPLAGLAFTVFDTETTGLQPLAGDEILQIGAVRIVNGRLLQGERFDQLVDPRRDIPAAGIPIHGITPDRVAGQPHILQVLPAFHAFAADSVLVAHNAAFDLRFLQLKERAAGLRFDQPVLDTLLLSAVVQPSADSHALDDVARRLGVPVVGRHTALGDAQVTADVFLRLLPLLADRGLTTLGAVRAACQQTQLARHQR